MGGTESTRVWPNSLGSRHTSMACRKEIRSVKPNVLNTPPPTKYNKRAPTRTRGHSMLRRALCGDAHKQQGGKNVGDCCKNVSRRTANASNGIYQDFPSSEGSSSVISTHASTESLIIEDEPPPLSLSGVANEFEQVTREAFTPLILERRSSDPNRVQGRRRKRYKLHRNRTKYNLLHRNRSNSDQTLFNTPSHPNNGQTQCGQHVADTAVGATTTHDDTNLCTQSCRETLCSGYHRCESDSDVPNRHGSAALRQCSDCSADEIKWLRCNNCEKSFPGYIRNHATPGFSSLIFCSGECRFSLVLRENVKRRRMEIVEKELIAARRRPQREQAKVGQSIIENESTAACQEERVVQFQDWHLE